MAYNFDKDVCNRCGISKKEAKKFPVNTGIDHPFYRYSTSFYLSMNGDVLCAKCNKEMELKKVFEAIDHYEKLIGEV